mmetsp:Transcript_5006/g.21289  ORF Transcript_5006/g.21289 Transcript_5006/m.21289 type:complete len:204 (+) Transcript_5006:2646-3257(+)
MSSSSRFQRGGRTRAHVMASVETSDSSITVSRSDRSRRRRSSRSESSRFIAASFFSSEFEWSRARCKASSSSSSIVRALSLRTEPMPVTAPPTRRRDRASNASMRLRAASLWPGVSARSAARDSRVCDVSPMDTSHRRTTATSAREWLSLFRSSFVASAFSASLRAFSATGSTKTRGFFPFVVVDVLPRSFPTSSSNASSSSS